MNKTKYPYVTKPYKESDTEKIDIYINDKVKLSVVRYMLLEHWRYYVSLPTHVSRNDLLSLIRALGKAYYCVCNWGALSVTDDDVNM